MVTNGQDAWSLFRLLNCSKSICNCNVEHDNLVGSNSLAKSYEEGISVEKSQEKVDSWSNF